MTNNHHYTYCQYDIRKAIKIQLNLAIKARLHSKYYEDSLRYLLKAFVWAHFATICCMSRDQPVLSMMKSHCYSGLWAEGAVIENILANKQRFIGTIEARTERRIMQWNLTGLCGATWAEELINVWGPAGVICTFVDVLGSHTGALIELNIEQMFSWSARHLCTNHWRDIPVEMSVTVIFTSDINHPTSMPPVILSLWGLCFLMMDYWW